jgi:hypothetical protein
MIETNTILNENIKPIKAQSEKGKASDESKLLSKYPVPFWKTSAFPDDDFVLVWGKF